LMVLDTVLSELRTGLLKRELFIYVFWAF